MPFLCRGLLVSAASVIIKVSNRLQKPSRQSLYAAAEMTVLVGGMQMLGANHGGRSMVCLRAAKVP